MPRLWILDLDGTVYRGSEAIEGAADVVEELLRRGGIVRYLTNNSAAIPARVSDKLNLMGIPCEPDWVYSSGLSAARSCRDQGFKRVFLVGEPALHQMVEEQGLSVGADADAVLAGICRSVTYELIDGALQELLRGVPFIATNRDATYPLEAGRLQPGAGAIVGAIAATSGLEPTVIGKPSPLMVEQVLRDAGVSASEAMVVGDRPETDLESGRQAGVPTWLVLTGVTREAIPGQDGSPDLRGLLDL